jgi:methylated-DNA-[protein]-cysteine S-methyltransferase
MKMDNIFFYSTIIGKIGIQENGHAITKVYLPHEEAPKDATVIETELLKVAAKQLQNYFEGKRRSFTLPLELKGTEFMLSVWKELQNIPYGETCSYKDIAERIGNPKACRAVGLANNKNPIPIFIPCHRVIGANGKLVGFAGGLEMKEQLLDLEKRNKNREI